MTITPLTPEERLARLEGVYDHLATKADIARVEGKMSELEAALKADIAELKAELYKGLNRNLYITIGAVAAAVTLMKYLP